MRLLFLLPILLAGCADETISGFADRDAEYSLVELNGEPFVAKATIAFPEAGRVMGQGPCNSWSARQSVPYPWINIDKIAATRRACADLEWENAFFDALGTVSLAEVNGDVLILSGDGAEMVFRRK